MAPLLRQKSPRPLRSIAPAGFGGLLGGVGGGGFLAAFDGADLFPALLMATAAGTLVAWCGLLVDVDHAERWTRWAGTAAVRVAVVVAGLVAALAVVPGTTPEALVHLGEGWAGLRNGHTPVSPGSAPAGAVIAVPAVLIVVAAASGAWLAAPEGWRLRAWGPSLSVMTLGFLVGDERTGAPVGVPVAWGLLVLGTVVVAGRGRVARPDLWPGPAAGDTGSRPEGWRVVVAGTTVLATLVLVGAASVPAGEWVPLGDKRERLPRDPGAVPVEEEQPLSQVAILRSGPDEPLFTVDSPVPVGRWYLTVLDRYDGATWSGDQEFRPAAERLPATTACPASPEATGTAVTHRVRLAGPDDRDSRDDAADSEDPAPPWGRWLPVPARATAVSEDGLHYDRASGTLRAPPGEPVPDTYEVTATVPAADGTTSRLDARVPEGSSAWDSAGLPDIGGSGAAADMLDDLAQQADELTAGAPSDYARAAALSQYLLAGELMEEDEPTAVPPGVSLAAVHGFLPGSDEPPQGTVEQFVTAFAVLARAIDLPTRVVVGFDGSAAAGDRGVSAHDATAWAEVCFEDLGWVAFDAVPDETGEVQPPPPPEPTEPADRDDDPDRPDEDDDESGPGDDPADRADGQGGDDVGDLLRRWTGTALLLVALALLVGVGAPMLWRPLRRWRRRRAAAPAARVAGAWATVVDDLRAVGGTFSEATPVSEVASSGGRRLPDAAGPLGELGVLVNRAAFARGGPSVADAERAWHLADTVLATRRRQTGVSDRLRAVFRR